MFLPQSGINRSSEVASSTYCAAACAAIVAHYLTYWTESSMVHLHFLQS